MNQFDEILTMTDEEMEEELSFLAEGSSRFVYEADESHIVKLPFSEPGVIQNQMEFTIWQEANAEQRQLLCPVTAGLIKLGQFQSEAIIMEKAEPMEDYRDEKGVDIHTLSQHLEVESFEATQVYKTLLPLIEKHTLYVKDLNKLSNWGRVNGRLVLLDYGCTNSVYEEFY